MDANILQGINQPVQPGVAMPDNTSTQYDDSQNENPYNATFWDYLKSVSGINFYKNIFGGWNDNPGNGVLDLFFRDPKTGYSSLDFWKNNFLQQSRVGDAVGDLIGATDSTSYDDNPYNDLPDELYDIFNQGVKLFQENSSRQEAFNASEAAKLREWQEYMSNTAYQRAMIDLKKAGINPLLAFGSGMSPASTPSGAQASASLGNSNSLFSSMASSVLGDKKLTMQLLTALLGIFRIFSGQTTSSFSGSTDSTIRFAK